MYQVLLELGFWNAGDQTHPRTLERCVEHVLEGLTRHNQEYLARFPETPGLYESGIRYRDDSADQFDRFRDIPLVLQSRWGDCDDLVPWRAAELRAAGVPARPIIISGRNGSYLYHTIVQLPDGNTEDPSRILGM